MSCATMGTKMIRSLAVSNYRSLGPDTHLEFERLSVLIGPNGSGKSNALDVLTFVRDAVLQGLPAAVSNRGGIDSVRRRSHGHPYNVAVQLSIQLDAGAADYAFEITGDRKEEYRVKSETVSVRTGKERHHYERNGSAWQGPAGLAPRLDPQSLALTTLGGDTRFKALVDYLSQLTVYAIFPDVLREPQKFDATRPMKRHGENWVSILRELLKEPAKDELIKGLAKLTGDIEDARVTSAAGYLVAEFKQEAKARHGKRWFDASQQSDGTLRVAGLLTALLQSPTLPVVGVEEPELTVHPGALPMLVDYLHQASELAQVLVTTHSPILLDVLDIDRDAVLVVNRTEGITRIQRVPPDRLEPVRKSLLRLGDLFISGDLQLELSLFED